MPILAPILALDTAIHQCAAAVRLADGRIVARAERQRTGHAERLPGMVAEVLAEAGIGFADLSALACTIGPGSFTGIRVALALARGYALTLDCQIVGITTLAAMAAPLAGSGEEVITAIDAGRNEVYAARYAADGTESVAPACLPLTTVAGWQVGRGGVVAGSAADRLNTPGWRIAENDLPDIASVARLAAGLIAAGARGGAPEPLYLRPPDATPSTWRLERAADFFA